MTTTAERLNALLANADQIVASISAADREQIVALHQQASDASSPHFLANRGTLMASVYELIAPSVQTAYGQDLPADINDEEGYPEVLNAVLDGVLSAKAA